MLHTTSYRQKVAKLDLTLSAKKALMAVKLNELISIDTKALLVEVEAGISYGDLVHMTLQHHCLPKVVPELKAMTVGGALAGVALESSSFKQGFMHEGVVEFDVLTSEGELITCRKDNEHQALFYAFPNSYGTLGFVTRIVLELMPAKPYVEVNHLHFTHPKRFFQKLTELCNHSSSSIQYIEAVSFSPKEMYITVGQFVDHVPYLNSYEYMKIYYQSIQELHADFLKTEDYIWRWDADWFWCSKNYGLQNLWLRLLLGKWFLNSNTYWSMAEFTKKRRFFQWIFRKMQARKESIVQDVLIHDTHAAAFFLEFQKKIGMKPIWICPVLQKDSTIYPLLNVEPQQLYLNFGFWGTINRKQDPHYYNHWIEKKVRHYQGRKSLYAKLYCSAKEFWGQHSLEAYVELKKRYDPCESWPDLFQKLTKRDAE